MGGVTNPENEKLADLNRREKLALAPICLLILVMGVYPAVFLSRSGPSVEEIRNKVTAPNARAEVTFTNENRSR
jgi:NADH-quinone oxidoreductase subunit M